MATRRTDGLLTLIAIVVASMSLYLLGAGAWLVALGGSWYYAVAGAALLVVAWLLWRRRRSALWLYAALVLGTLGWALWESGLDWWPLAARGDVLFLVGLLLISAWVERPLRDDGTDRPRRWWPARAALAASLALFLVVGIASWFSHPYRLEGTVARAGDAASAQPVSGVPPGEWRAYGRTEVRDRSPIPLPFRMGVPDLGGPIVTASGVAFLSGTLDYYVRGYDVATGEQLWRARLPAGGQATPMTYLGKDGRQYLVVVAGGHGSLGTKAGDSVIAYALPAG
jgi:glucose dehydrogenase